MSLLLLSGLAQAEQHGLVARLQLNGESIKGSAAIVLKPEGGEPTRIELADNGTAPDVTKGDGIWAGSAWLDGDAFTVSVDVDGTITEGGPVTWGATDANRDLTIGMKGGQLSVEAGVSGGGGGGPSPGAGGDAAVDPSAGGGSGGGALPDGAGGAPVGPGFPPGMPPGTAPGVSGAAKSGADGTLYIGFGLGLLVLVGLAWLWLRNRPAERSAGGLPRVPEPGLLGEGTPSLSDGLQLWLTSDADADAVVRPLLATLARHHRVLFVAPGKVTAPPVYGGPVYRAPNIRPSHVGDSAESMGADGGVAVLLVNTQADAASLKDYADLMPSGIGSVCVLTQDPGVAALPRVTARREGPVWVVQTGERTLHLREGAQGFEEVTGA